MNKFLRYNSPHCLHFSREGMPQLNPTSYKSWSASGKKPFSWDEPLWLFRLRQRWFCEAGRHRCGSRAQNQKVSVMFGGDKELPDTWNLGPDGNRTCSYCHSLHPEDLMKICSLTLVDPRYSVDPSDKDYKVYVKQPMVVNASQGAIKFYKWHVGENPSTTDQELYAAAVKVSRERFRAKYYSPREA